MDLWTLTKVTGIVKFFDWSGPSFVGKRRWQAGSLVQVQNFPQTCTSEPAARRLSKSTLPTTAQFSIVHARDSSRPQNSQAITSSLRPILTMLPTVVKSSFARSTFINSKLTWRGQGFYCMQFSALWDSLPYSNPSTPDCSGAPLGGERFRGARFNSWAILAYWCTLLQALLDRVLALRLC